ncbi:MAG: ClpX C4-type zinc finger protein [Thiohalophilus sp.]
MSVRWLTPQEAARRHAEYTRDPRCAFCGKLFPGYEKLIAGDGACICHDCIDYYHECYVIRPHVRENTPTRRTAS